MRKITVKVLAIFSGVLLTPALSVNAQIFYNNGAQVYAAPGSVVQINGGLQNDNSGNLDNEGNITVTSNGATPGNILLSNLSVMQGNGHYTLSQDWINNATFTCNNSSVFMNGNTAEYITSTNATVTTFDTLELQGAGAYASINARKIQTLDSKVQGALLLNDRKLWTQTHTMFITTAVVSAVTNSVGPSQGFVESDVNGSLSRMTNSITRYFFPVGSDSGTLRYRPVFMKPVAANADVYTVRMANVNATNDGDSTELFDTNICHVNQLYYHKINRTSGNDNSDIDIYFLAADGPWTGIAQWNAPVAAVWNDMGPVTATVGAFNDNLKTNWSNFSQDPYILDNVKPSTPVLNCSGVCAEGNGSFVVTGNGSSYTWTTPAGTTILSGQGTDSINVQWNNIPGNISVIANSVGGCSSRPASCTVNVNAAAVSGFDTASSGTFHNNWIFTDSSKNATSWHWNFGDGDTSNVSDPNHIYSGAGTYIVSETITNKSGCSSERIDTVIVTSGFIVPNVFTPNGDGKNDVFAITCSGTSSYSISIFNRWGQEIFTSNSVNISWDGRTNAGVKVSDGTYFYIISATSTSGQNWNKQGYVQVIGSTSGGQ